ncbi:MAG: 3-hydroxy-3-methylglutaryl CoA synthase, partial [Candidatus Thermoplasmatota archaeon]|nr:3-hydroxy-3-methylglutaryl CoA synthase [Candidatus Thermoplasmatota archaeon]
HAGPPGEFQAQHEASGAYDVVIVDLDDGGRVIGQAACPPGKLAIGDEVRPVLRRLFQQEGRWRYALKWWPQAFP